MSDPAAKRRFWRIHLSSAVVMMLAAGAVIGLNLRNRMTRAPWRYGELIKEGTESARFELGWPVTAVENDDEFEGYSSYVAKLDREYGYLEFRYNLDDLKRRFAEQNAPKPIAAVTPSLPVRVGLWFEVLKPLATNVFAGLAIMLIVVVLNEFRIRRRVHA